MNNKNVRLYKKYHRSILMTTVIGVKCINGFVIGSDSQLSIGSTNRELGFDKIYKMGSTLVAFSGDQDYFERVQNDVEDKLNAKINNFNELTKIFEECMKNLYDNYPITDENYTEIIFGTSIKNKTNFYRINSHDCFSIRIDKYYPTGTGSVFAKYILKRLWNTKLKNVDASSILAHVIQETTTIDQASNPPINIAHINNNGIIIFLKKEQIDRIVNSISDADKFFTSIFKIYILKPKFLEFSDDGIRIRNKEMGGENDKQKKV